MNSPKSFRLSSIEEARRRSREMSAIDLFGSKSDTIYVVREVGSKLIGQKMNVSDLSVQLAEFEPELGDILILNSRTTQAILDYHSTFAGLVVGAAVGASAGGGALGAAVEAAAVGAPAGVGAAALGAAVVGALAGAGAGAAV
ncbi:MAG: hypothetical protein O2911_09380, partial [Bacteroidetes bacterium]|nr:hypothetical protein [Bacteroidota bacterium]